MSDPNTELERALGRIEGKLDMIVASQALQNKRLDNLDDRLRVVERQAAVTGAISGGIASIGTAIAVELLKRAF